MSLCDRAFEDPGAFGEFAPYIYVRRPGIDRETRDHDAFDQLVRVFMNDVTVFERPGLGFVGVTNQIDRFFFIRLDEAPFYAARKSGAAPSAQSRRLHFVDDVSPGHLERLLQIFIAAFVEIGVDIDAAVGAPDVFKNNSTFEGMRRAKNLEVRRLT